MCKQTDTLETVPEYLCDSFSKPSAEEECNADACRVRATCSVTQNDLILNWRLLE